MYNGRRLTTHVFKWSEKSWLRHLWRLQIENNILISWFIQKYFSAVRVNNQSVTCQQIWKLGYPVIRRRWPNVGLMLGQCARRWCNLNKHCSIIRFFFWVVRIIFDKMRNVKSSNFAPSATSGNDRIYKFGYNVTACSDFTDFRYSVVYLNKSHQPF